MPADRLQQVVRRLTPPETTDADLLARFAADRDEAAFAALVARHGPMVLAACRRLLGYHDAEDACQATFLVLARRATGLRINGSVAAWLHGVARRAARAARRAADRRRVHEARVTPACAVSGPDKDGTELRAVLDDEIACLPAKYRTVLVLAELQGRRRPDVAAELGIPVGTVASRHARARILLAARLRRRGWAPAALLAAATPLGLSEALARRTVSLAVGGRVAGAAMTPPELLAREVMTTMTRTKLALTAVGLGVVLVAVGLAGNGPTPARKGNYSVYTDNGSTILVDSTTGKSWVLQQTPGKNPAWVPVKGPEPPPARSAEPPPKSGPPDMPSSPPPVKGGVQATGRLVLSGAYKVHSRTPGLVTRVHVRAGDTVVSGQMLAELDDTDAKLAVDAAMANLAVTEVSHPPRERALPAQEIRLFEAEVKKAQVEVARAKAALQATKLVAPTAGTVVELNAAAGDPVTPTGPALAMVADLRSLAAVVSATESDARSISVGQECLVQVGALNTEEYPGVVVGVGATVEVGTETILVRVRLRVLEGKRPPPAGSFVRVQFLKKE
jgi:RNA polymerase sigma factor (sigma-70 family)